MVTPITCVVSSAKGSFSANGGLQCVGSSDKVAPAKSLLQFAGLPGFAFSAVSITLATAANGSCQRRASISWLVADWWNCDSDIAGRDPWRGTSCATNSEPVGDDWSLAMSNPLSLLA